MARAPAIPGGPAGTARSGALAPSRAPAPTWASATTAPASATRSSLSSSLASALLSFALLPYSWAWAKMSCLADVVEEQRCVARASAVPVLGRVGVRAAAVERACVTVALGAVCPVPRRPASDVARDMVAGIHGAELLDRV